MSDKIVIVLDTETVGNSNLVYNLGYVVANLETGEVLQTRNYLVRQYFDNRALMNSAYYANKIPLYLEGLKSGTCKRIYWGSACHILKKDIEKFGACELFAYNSPFDLRAIANTCDDLKAKHNPTQKGITDIMKLAKSITNTKEYEAFCKKYGFLTRHTKPRCQRKAETVYRYLTNNPDYVEEHTALEDSKIELAILLSC